MIYNKIIGLILVRSKSKRLPNKCFMDFGNFCVLEHIIKRCRFYNILPIVCTTNLKSDSKIIKLCKKLNISYYRGSEKNKILRISKCCKKFKIDIFHTIDADDPFFCGEEVKRSINELKTSSFDIIEPTKISSNGSGLVGYSARADIFHQLSKKIKKNMNTEMMWNYFKILKNINVKKLSKSKYDCNARLTLDYKEDYIFLDTIRMLLGNFANRQNILRLLKKNPDLYKINFFRNKQWKANQNKYE